MDVISMLVGRSPFVLVMEHGQKVHECVGRLSALFLLHLDGGGREELSQLARQVSDLESEADQIRNALHEGLSGKVMIAVGRRDLLEIVDQQDSMADRAEEVALNLTFRQSGLSDDQAAEIVPFVEIVFQNCAIAAGVISKLHLLIQSSFGERDTRTVRKLINELSGRDDLTRDANLAATRRLFAAADSFSSVELMWWIKILGLLAEMSHFAERTANRLRIVIENQRA